MKQRTIQILVVDDEPDIRLLFNQSFKEEIASENFLFYFASNGEQALKILEKMKTQIVLILSDINMPGMSGLELLKEIKRLYSDLPVFMITAYGNSENSEIAWQSGAEEIISKPINFEYLKSLIHDNIRLRNTKELGSDNDKNSSS